MRRDPGGLREFHLLTSGEGRIDLGLRVRAKGLELLVEFQDLRKCSEPQCIDRQDRQWFHPRRERFQALKLTQKLNSRALEAPLRPCRFSGLRACLNGD